MSETQKAPIQRDLPGTWKIVFGKFKGSTYENLLKTDEGRSYLEWLYGGDRVKNPKLRQYLEENLSSVGMWKIAFGRYKGMRYQDLFDDEKGRDYAEWIVQNNVTKNKQIEKYLRDQLYA